MKKTMITLAVLLFFVQIPAQKNTWAESINSFSFKLFDQLFSNKNNCFYSPFSIYCALSMSYAGTKENTQLELEQVLELKEKDKIHQEIAELSNSLALERELTILTANSIWLQKSIRPEKKFAEIVKDSYQAKIDNVSFASENDREKVRKQINGFIEEQTKGNIADFMPKGLLDENTAMILINAVYFNAAWHVMFEKDKTVEGKFQSASGDSVKCQMMQLENENNYYEDEKMQVLEIPYQNNKVSMLVFLPKSAEAAGKEIFTMAYYQNVLGLLKKYDTKISLPKFKLATSYELSESLVKMGMKSAFAPGADFSGITGKKDIILDKILHKSVVEVSEKGTEASSATAVISMRSTKITKEQVEFKADRPFFFVIKENSYNLILFTGYLAQP